MVTGDGQGPPRRDRKTGGGRLAVTEEGGGRPYRPFIPGVMC